MAKNNRIFISFAVEDADYRTMLVGQARNGRSPFAFVDMSVKEPWDERWKSNCRTKIKGCDGLIALISSNTLGADGARWEIKCANEEKIPVLGVQISSKAPAAVPPELAGKPVIAWTWDGIAKFINSL
jgi:hypothetical protein